MIHKPRGADGKRNSRYEGTSMKPETTHFDIEMAKTAERIAMMLTSPNFTYNDPDYIRHAKDIIYTALKNTFETGMYEGNCGKCGA